MTLMKHKIFTQRKEVKKMENISRQILPQIPARISMNGRPFSPLMSKFALERTRQSLKLATLILTIFLSSCDYCPAQSINLDHIGEIESNSRPNAIGDNGKSFGIYQISVNGILADFNKFNSANLKPEDLFSEEKSAHLALWAFNEHLPRLIRAAGKPVNERNLIIAWNCGTSCLNRKELPRITKHYLKKYAELSK